MIEFNVSGMTCGHCVAAVKRAVGELDAQAKVEVDLSSGRVTVASTAAVAALKAAIEEEGYTVETSQ